MDRKQSIDTYTKDTKRLIMSFQNVDTYLANNNKRALTIQLMMNLAELEGIATRQERYADILAAQ
jgi:hypothetical protein